MEYPYDEKYCRICPFKKGEAYEPNTGFDGLSYIDCQRDNEDARDRFSQTLDEKDALLWSQQCGNFEQCLFHNEIIAKMLYTYSKNNPS